MNENIAKPKIFVNSLLILELEYLNATTSPNTYDPSVLLFSPYLYERLLHKQTDPNYY